MAISIQAQFKEIGPAPFPPAIAHQKIKALLETVDPGNRKQTLKTLSGWVAWYRDILDEELVAAWQKDTRANLPELIEALSDERVAAGVIGFSWRERRESTFNLAYASMLTSLMSRYPVSAEPFSRDLSERDTLELSPQVAQAVCRILLDMPDIGVWKQKALQILPHYSEAAMDLLSQDLHASDEDKKFRAEMWLSALKRDTPTRVFQQQSERRNLPLPPAFDAEREPIDTPRRIHVDGPRIVETESRPAAQARPPSAAVPQVMSAYNGPQSGTYESNGGPIPQNAEFVFRNLPPVNIRLDYDTKIWEARLVPGEGKTQRLIVRNKSAGPQKHCTIHWKVIP